MKRKINEDARRYHLPAGAVPSGRHGADTGFFLIQSSGLPFTEFALLLSLVMS